MPVNHPVSGPVLTFDLVHELRTLRAELERTGSRTARTLVKEGPLRATLVGIDAGGELRPHQADGPVTIHVLEGEVEFEADGRRWPLVPGAFLSLAPGVTHGVRSATGGVFLLTVVAPASA